MNAKDRLTLTLMLQAAVEWEESYIDSLRASKGMADAHERWRRERLLVDYRQLAEKLIKR